METDPVSTHATGLRGGRMRSIRPKFNLLTFVTFTLLCLGSLTGVVQSAEEEWRDLFNGQDLSGWQIKCKPEDRSQSFWRVVDGAIEAYSMGVTEHDYVWLVSRDEFRDFKLKMKFQAFRDSPGNSGIQIRSRYDDMAGWLDGPQIDIQPPEPWRTGMMWDETRGNQRWIHPDIPAGKWVDKLMSVPDRIFYYSDDQPEWNEFEVEAKGTRITAFLNGVKVTDLDGAGILDDDLHNHYRVGLEGHLALQIHKGDQLRIRFKDIQVLSP